MADDVVSAIKAAASKVKNAVDPKKAIKVAAGAKTVAADTVAAPDVAVESSVAPELGITAAEVPVEAQQPEAPVASEAPAPRPLTPPVSTVLPRPVTGAIHPAPPTGNPPW